MNIQIQLILTIPRFSHCKLAYLPKFICYSKINTVAFSWLIVDMQRDEKFWWYSQLKLDKTILCLFIFNLPTGNSYPFMAYLLSAMFCSFVLHFCSSSVTSLFHTMAPKHSAMWCSYARRLSCTSRENACVR